MKLYFTVLKGHSFDGSFEGGIKFKYEWNGSSSLVLMDEIKRLYPRLSALTVFITGDVNFCPKVDAVAN